MPEVKAKLDVKEEFLQVFLEELKWFDGKHYDILELEVDGKKTKG